MKPVIEAAVQLGIVVVGSVGMLLADVTVNEGVLGGAGVGIIIVVGNHLVNWYLRVKKERDESKVVQSGVNQTAADKQAARDRKTRRDAFEEWQQTVADLRQDRELDRKELHEVREMAQQERTDHAITKVRLDQCEKDRAELFRRVEALEQRE